MGEKKSSPESVKMPFLRLAINYLIIEVVGKLLNCNMSKIEPSASNLPKVSLFMLSNQIKLKHVNQCWGSGMFIPDPES
jgi:hypothetical protein